MITTGVFLKLTRPFARHLYFLMCPAIRKQTVNQTMRFLDILIWYDLSTAQYFIKESMRNIFWKAASAWSHISIFSSRVKNELNFMTMLAINDYYLVHTRSTISLTVNTCPGWLCCASDGNDNGFYIPHFLLLIYGWNWTLISVYSHCFQSLLVH